MALQRSGPQDRRAAGSVLHQPSTAKTPHGVLTLFAPWRESIPKEQKNGES